MALTCELNNNEPCEGLGNRVLDGGKRLRKALPGGMSRRAGVAGVSQGAPA